MRGRDGIISQNTIRKPFEKAASVDVAALTALLDKTQKRKKKSPALFQLFSHFRRFGETVVNGEKRLKRTLSKKLPNSESAWR
jgi:hypothetical protein